MQTKLVRVSGILIALILLILPVAFPLSGEPGADGVVALGRFHIIVLHLPIGLLLVVPLLEILGRFEGLKELRKASFIILFLALLFGFKACILGYLLAAGEGDSGPLLTQHMWGGILTTVFMAITLILKEVNLKRQNSASFAAYAVALVLSIITLTLGSHHGASMVHGEDYLYAKIPPKILNLFTPKNKVQITIQSLAYESLIQPIFQEHCFVCHSAAKEKGGYRMDDFDLLLLGGDGGMPGIEPGSLEDSEVHYRITQKPSSKAFMPPDGRPPLTKDQLELISWWIQQGGSETATIGDLAEGESPAVLLRLLEDHETPTTHSQVPMDWELFSSISTSVKNDFGIDVILESQNLADGAYIASRNANDPMPGKAFTALHPLAEHITSINLWRRQLEPNAAKELAAFHQMTALHLNESNISNQDLTALQSLKKLKLLNLYSTKIDDAAIPTLSGFQSLETLLLHNSAMTSNGVEQLRKALPNCEVSALSPSLELPVKEAKNKE